MDDKWRKVIAIAIVPVLAVAAFLTYWFIRPDNQDETTLPTEPPTKVKTYEIDLNPSFYSDEISIHTWSNKHLRDTVVPVIVDTVEEGITINNPDNQVFDIWMDYRVVDNSMDFIVYDTFYNGENTITDVIGSFRFEIV